MSEDHTQRDRVRIGSPAVTTEGILAVMDLLLRGRISEGEAVNELEILLADILKVKHAVLFNSGHSALVASYLTAKRLHGCEEAVTTALTFISTASAAIEAGLELTVIDTKRGSFLINEEIAREVIQKSERNCVYVPVHLFGYRAGGVLDAFTLQDCCEAFGTGLPDDPVGVPDIGCFSFYTSHVLGCGEMGCAVTDSDDDSMMLRKIKDQGRTFLRPAGHVDAGVAAEPARRYSHDTLGYNFRTTDIQAALLLGALGKLPHILQRRREVVKGLNDALSAIPEIRTPDYDAGVSYLAYPIICESEEVRNKLINGLDEQGIETRPLMSVVPEEEALHGKVSYPSGYREALDVHRRSLYISAHESLTEEDVSRVSKGVREIMAKGAR